MSDATKAREESQKRASNLADQWKAINQSFPHAVEDLLDYLNSTKELYLHYGMERGMTGPDGKYYTIDDHTIAAYLQGARVCDMVKTYIESRIDPDVAQPIKNSK